MQPSWFTVPWVQFQSLPTFPTPTLTTLGQMAPPHPPTAVSVGGITPMAAPTPTHTQVNGLSGVTLPLNGLNGLAHGGLVAIPSPPPIAAHAHAHAHPAAHPAHPHPAAALALQQVLRRPAHQPVPAPLAALIRAKKESEFSPGLRREKRKAEEELMESTDIKKAKLETKALKAKRPGFSEERYNETSYFIENGLRKVYPYYFTFTTFTKGRWVGEKILDVFAKEFRAHPAEQYERCIKTGTLTVNYEKVDTDYRLKHNDLLANIVHRHETPVLAHDIVILHLDEELVVLDKPCSLPVHPCGRYRHNTVVFILAKEYNLKNLRTIHRLDRLTSGLLLFGRTPKKAREMEQQIRTRQVTKEYVCRVEGEFPRDAVECVEPIEVVSYKIGVCKVSAGGKDCRTEFQRLSFNGTTSVVLCRPHTGRMHQIRVHLQYLGYPIVNDPLYNHTVFGPNKAKGGIVGKSDDQLIQDLIKIHNAENWLGMDGDAEYSMFKAREKGEGEEEGGSQRNTPSPKDKSPPQPPHHYPKMSPPPPPPPPPHHHHHHHDASAGAANGLTVAAGLETLEGGGGGAGGGGSGGGTTQVSSSTQTSDNQGGGGGGGGGGGVGGGGKEYGFQSHLMTVDEHCYECKVRYRDPKPRDLVMYLHALKYSGPGWQFETKLPDWANEDWRDPEDDQ